MIDKSKITTHLRCCCICSIPMTQTLYKGLHAGIKKVC
jgi:hypothetical protein